MMELGAAFILGLFGSLHCAGMCGPLMIALPTAQRTGLPFLVGRVIYHLGRLATYGLIGLSFGLVGKTLLLAGVQRWVSIAIGAVLILSLVASSKFSLTNAAGRFVSALRRRMGSLLQQRSLASLAALGALNGLLPCGLVYIAAAGALATGGIVSGIFYMGVFGLGTLPMMLAISLSGNLLPGFVRLYFRKAVPVSIFLLGSLLILRGMGLGIPYLSPNLSASGAPCCH